MKASRLVRAARKRKGLSQRELAAKTRISQPMISLIERGLQDPRYSTLQRIFRACDLEMDVERVDADVQGEAFTAADASRTAFARRSAPASPSRIGSATGSFIRHSMSLMVEPAISSLFP